MRLRTSTALLSIAIGLAAIGAMASPERADTTPIGEWWNEAGDIKVRIAPCPDNHALLCGTIVDATKTAAGRTDSQNPNPALRGRSIIGVRILNGFTHAGPGSWDQGEIYDTRNGKSYKSQFALQPNGTLVVKGCVWLICKSQTWKRA